MIDLKQWKKYSDSVDTLNKELTDAHSKLCKEIIAFNQKMVRDRGDFFVARLFFKSFPKLKLVEKSFANFMDWRIGK